MYNCCGYDGASRSLGSSGGNSLNSQCFVAFGTQHQKDFIVYFSIENQLPLLVCNRSPWLFKHKLLVSREQSQ